MRRDKIWGDSRWQWNLCRWQAEWNSKSQVLAHVARRRLAEIWILWVLRNARVSYCPEWVWREQLSLDFYCEVDS